MSTYWRVRLGTDCLLWQRITSQALTIDGNHETVNGKHPTSAEFREPEAKVSQDSSVEIRISCRKLNKPLILL